MGITVLMERLQAAVIHDPVDIVVKLSLRRQPVFPHRLTDDLTYRQSRRQAGKGILEDDLHLRPHGPHLFVGKVVDLFAVKQHLPAGLLPGQA